MVICHFVHLSQNGDSTQLRGDRGKIKTQIYTGKYKCQETKTKPGTIERPCVM